MKTIYNNICIWVLAILTLAACDPYEESKDALGAIPSAEGIDATVNVNQETNMVTFTLNNATGYYPVWIFTNDKGESTTSTQNGYSKLYAKMGDYTVEVKLGNKNGISEGSITKTFHIDQTLVDEALVKALCGGLDASTKVWVWNSKVAGHFGCGASGSENGLGWWTCGAEEKEGLGMYDDSFTFGADNSYTYDPGEGGTVFVNKGCTRFPEYDPANNTDAGTDYQAVAALQNRSWELNYEGDNLYLVFPAGTFVGYVPGDAIYDAPKFRVVSISEEKLVMVSDDGSTAWRFEFIPKDLFDAGGSQKFDEGMDLSADKYNTGIVASWTWETSTQGHFGCGENADNPTGWWTAAPDEKADWGLYDDVLAFAADGSYTFDPGEGGQVYVNKGCTVFPEYVAGAEEDYTATVGKQTSTYQITEEGGNYYLVFPAKTIVSYVCSDAMYNAPKYKIIRMTTTMLELASVEEGISWKYRLKKAN